MEPQRMSEKTHYVNYVKSSPLPSVYWTNYGDGTVVKVPLGGGAPIVLASGQDSPASIAVDATSVTWVNEDGGNVMRLTPK
jgi:hypothetical protein